MTAPMKLMLTIFVILLLAFGFYLGDWSERWQRRNEARQAIQRKQEQWRELKKALQELPQLQRQSLSLKNRLDRQFASNVQENADELIPNVVSQLEQLAGRTLKIRSLSPGAAAPAREDLPPVNNRVVNLNLQGSYSATADFLYQLGDLRLITINSLTISKGQANNLIIDLPLTAYQR